MAIRGMMDGWHGDEHLVECRRDCKDYCECAEIDADIKADADYESWRDEQMSNE